LVFPAATSAASTNQVITATGQPLVSVFDGLKPSWFAHPSMLKRWQSTGRARVWTGQLKSTSPLGTFSRLGARYVEAQCVTCPNTEACSGHFTVIVALPPGVGCGDPVGCPFVDNFTNDPSRADICDRGEQNSYCGVVCCVDAEICDNFSGCP